MTERERERERHGVSCEVRVTERERTTFIILIGPRIKIIFSLFSSHEQCTSIYRCAL